MKLTLKFTEGYMMDIQLLARWQGRSHDDNDALAVMIGLMVRGELDKIRQPEPQKGVKSGD